MATPRSLTVDPSRSGIYHCASRCVRRAFLCGRDFYTGRSYEHRRDWVTDRVKELAGLFSVEICSYSVMSNHVHVIVRTLPEQVAGWDDREVAWRWLQLFPGPGKGYRRDPQGRLLPPEEDDVQKLCGDAGKLPVLRKRLANLSWFMRCLNEPIARRANQEDGCTGHFWEGRFECEKLDDEGALLACMQYVDLNPIRAGIAEAPEDSEFTSAQDRTVARRARRQLAHDLRLSDLTPEQAALIAQAKVEATRDAWLAPLGPVPAPAGPQPPAPRIEANAHLSDHADAASGFDSRSGPPGRLLAHVSEEDYLNLLDWTGRQMRANKRGSISPDLRPILERLDLDVEAWVDNVQGFGSLFYRVAGKIPRLKELAKNLGRTWFRGHAGAHKLYAKAA